MINNKLLDRMQELIAKEFNNKYKILTQLGQGSFSNVFQCQDNEGNIWALKIITLSQLTPQIIEYMENEIKILQKNLDNPNIIKLQDQKQTDEYIFLVMEYCIFDLEIVRQKYFNNQISEDLAIIILRQIANGLSFLHKNKIIHRDLKLENIGVVLKDQNFNEITQNDFQKATFKLLDFGLSKILGDSEHTSTFLGTPCNMAPEILEDKEYSFEVDMYSFGCCLFRMITGEFPYYQKRASLLIKKIQSESAQIQLIKNPNLKEVIQQMLRYDLNQRITWQQLYQNKLLSTNSLNQINLLDIRLFENSQFYREQNQKSEMIQNEKQISHISNIQENSKSYILMNENKKDSLLQDWIQKLNLHINYSKAAQMIYQCLYTIQTEDKCKKAKYHSLFAQFQQYIEYLANISELIFNDLLKNFNDEKSKQETNKDVLRFGNFLIHFQETNPKFNWNDFLLQWKKNVSDFKSEAAYKLSETVGCIPKLKQESSKLLQMQIENNKILFNQVKRILQDLEYQYKINQLNQIQELKQLKHLLYQALIYLVQIRAILENKINFQIDFKIFEFQIENCVDNPDQLLTILSCLFSDYGFHYEELPIDNGKRAIIQLVIMCS